MELAFGSFLRSRAGPFRHTVLVNRGIVPLLCVVAATVLAGCSVGSASVGTSSPPSIPAAELTHIRTCVDELARTSGRPTTATAYPTTAAALTQDLMLPLSTAASGDVYLVWMQGSFIDPYGSVTVNGATQPAPTVMWMAIPAGSPEAACPTDDVGFATDLSNADPTVLGPGVAVP